MTVRSFAPRRPGAARHAKTGFLSELLSQAPARKTTSRLSPHTAASSRRAADATPRRRDGAARHPRASATAATTRQAVHCGSLATTGTAGRRRLRVPMPATWASTTAFSPDRPAKRPVGARRILPSSRAGSNPLGENQSLSSPPLEPRGLLLSVMRQKVGKERSQGVFAPLAIPPDWAANHQPRKFGLAPTPRGRFAAWALRPAT